MRMWAGGEVGMIKEYIIKIDEDQDKKDIHGGYPLTEPPLELVRCKDCKYCEYPKSKREWCKKGHLHGNAETWFCADGERQ